MKLSLAKTTLKHLHAQTGLKAGVVAGASASSQCGIRGTISASCAGSLQSLQLQK